jgi:hypothetical protein
MDRNHLNVPLISNPPPASSGPRDLVEAAIGILIASVLASLLAFAWFILSSLGALLAYWFSLCDNPALFHRCSLVYGTGLGAFAGALIIILVIGILWLGRLLTRICRLSPYSSTPYQAL